MLKTPSEVGIGPPLHSSQHRPPQFKSEDTGSESVGNLSMVTQLISGSATIEPRRRKWQPTPVFLPGESQGRGSLVGCHLWGHTKSDTTEVT